MHKFKKLALAAAIASTPMMATSLELLDDDMLSGVTGQDGITINLKANISVDMAIEDTSGAKVAKGLIDNPAYDAEKDAAAGDPTDPNHDPTYDPNTPERIDGSPAYTTHGGFIVMKDLHVKSDGITIDIDSGSSGAGDVSAGSPKGVLVVGVKIDGLEVSGENGGAFDIGVAGSSLEQGSSTANEVPSNARSADDWVDSDNNNVDGGFARAHHAVENYTTIASVGKLEIGEVRAGIELGPEASQFMTVQTDAFDLNIDGLTITDPTSDQDPAKMGNLGIQHIAIKNVEVDATVSITEDGLEVKSSDSTMDIALMGVGFGTKQGFADAGGIVLDPTDPAAGGDSKWGTIGNVYLLNLNMKDTTATISGR